VKRFAVVPALLFLLSAANLAPDRARAEQYPSRPITMVVPFSAGGPTDVLARIFAQYIGQSLGQQVVVENVTGAGGTLGAMRVAKAAPDGYTMIMGNLGTHAASVGIYKKLAYDPRTDFEPVILIGSTPMVLIVKKDLPVATLPDFLALARTKQPKLTFGSAGVGSISHLAILLLNKVAKTDVQHIPYRGLSQTVNDVLGGQIDGMFDQVVTATPHVLSGGEKAIVVTAPARASALPGVPSSAEAGMPELETIAWSALFFPKKTPRPIVERMAAVVDDAMRDPVLITRMRDLGSDLPETTQRTPQALATLVRAEIDKWVPLIRAADVTGE